jgi:hypothetical protein
MIIVNGCSFTAAAKDVDTWPRGFYNKGLNDFKFGLPSSTFQYNVVRNIAAGGSSNSVIRRRMFWHLNDPHNIQKPDYVIIQWSTIDRWDYPVFVDNDRAKNEFPRMSIHPERINKINYMCNGTDTLGYAKDFYEKYYSVYGALLETLENIYHTQEYLKEKNISYKMITIGNLLDMDVSIEKLHSLQNDTTGQKGNYINLKTQKNIIDKLENYENSWNELNIIKSLLEKIDFSKFIFTDNTNIVGFGGGIIEWFLNKNEQLTGGANHPSEEQHLRFFNEFLWPKIEKDVNEYKLKQKII